MTFRKYKTRIKLLKRMYKDGGLPKRIDQRMYIWWANKKREYILKNNLKCVTCGDPAETLHHPKRMKEYASADEYYLEPFENLIPVCHLHHKIVFHGVKSRSRRQR